MCYEYESPHKDRNVCLCVHVSWWHLSPASDEEEEGKDDQ